MQRSRGVNRNVRTEAIPTMSIADGEAVRAYFDAGPSHPVVFTDATRDWPAHGTWSLRHFADRFGDHLGRVNLNFFHSPGGRAMTLRSFIENMDRPLSEIPGFWVDSEGIPLAEHPDYVEDDVWSFFWQPFRTYPELLAEVTPFPPAFGVITARLPCNLSRLLEKLTGLEPFSIYITRRGGVTPLHRDYNHTVSCLVQFDGVKRATLFHRDVSDVHHLDGFDPDRPDFTAFPALRDATAYTADLQPGQMLITPPDWFHHLRVLEHSLTLSHNFFTPGNFADYFTCLLQDMIAAEDRDGLFRLLAKYVPTKEDGSRRR